MASAICFCALLLSLASPNQMVFCFCEAFHSFVLESAIFWRYLISMSPDFSPLSFEAPNLVLLK